MFLHGDRPAEAPNGNALSPAPAPQAPSPMTAPVVVPERQASPLPSLKRSQPASPGVTEPAEGQSKRLKVDASPGPSPPSPRAPSPLVHASAETPAGTTDGADSTQAASPAAASEPAVPSPAPVAVSSRVPAQAEESDAVTDAALAESVAVVSTPASESAKEAPADGEDAKMEDGEA